MDLSNVKFPSFEEILALWEDRKILSSDEFAGLADYLKGTAGRLAGNWDTRFVADLYSSLSGAWRAGLTLSDWLPEAQRILEAYGGTATIYGSAETWSAWYADLVFRNATQAAHAGGRYARMFSPTQLAEAPFVLYNAIHDFRTRPEHRALDGKVFRKNDPSARSYYPPLGHNCRCSLIELNDDDIRSGGYAITPGSTIPYLATEDGSLVGKPPKGWDADRVRSLVPDVLRRAASSLAA